MLRTGATPRRSILCVRMMCVEKTMTKLYSELAQVYHEMYQSIFNYE